MQKVKSDISIDVWAKLLPLQFKYFDTLQKQKKIESSYHLIGQTANMFIANVESDEELTKMISEDPMFFQTTREIYALTTRETHKKYLRQLLGKTPK